MHFLIENRQVLFNNVITFNFWKWCTVCLQGIAVLAVYLCICSYRVDCNIGRWFAAGKTLFSIVFAYGGSCMLLPPHLHLLIRVFPVAFSLEQGGTCYDDFPAGDCWHRRPHTWITIKSHVSVKRFFSTSDQIRARHPDGWWEISPAFPMASRPLLLLGSCLLHPTWCNILMNKIMACIWISNIDHWASTLL